ncbi:hypothetical protein AB0N31_32695 [Streptomyces sp. NPDC051051]|uniref:hypothetical protein n=1 Tax=Streptomyces sp. NPDC051051 TaxID=3155666 RepID=UPI003447F59C
MHPTEKPIVPRRGLRLDLIPREPHTAVVGIGGAALAFWVHAQAFVVLPLAFLVTVRVRIRRI